MVGGALGDFLAFIRGVQVSSAALGQPAANLHACRFPNIFIFVSGNGIPLARPVWIPSISFSHFYLSSLATFSRARCGLGIEFFWEEDSLIKLFKALQIFILALMAVSLSATITRGQGATGRIIGNVTDPSGAPVQGAKVTAENIATHISTEARSDKDGLFQILSLSIGFYKVTIQANGFRAYVFDNQKLEITQSLRLDAKLELGQQSDSIEVKVQAA